MSETDRPRPPSDAARSDGAAADLSANRSVESIDEVCQRWRSGETPDARAEIDRRRQQGVEVTKTEFVDLAYEAYAAAAEQGLSVDPRQYPEQFPTFHESVRRSIEVHQFIDDELGSATPIEDPMWPEVESQILDFYLIAELGRGVRARAYLAKNTRLGSRLEVVKVARTEDSYDEAESQGRLSHDNIVPVLHVKRDPITNLTVIIMPYLGRVTLADIIRDFLGRAEWPTHARSVLELAQADDAPTTMKPKPALNGSYLDAAIELGRQIAAGLSAAHDEGVVHGDMKPSNVLVTPAGRAMLLDFNLAQDEQRQWQLPRVGGTLPYLSTEQLQARYETQLAVETTAAESAKDYVMADRQTDLFSLGVILYELLTGKYPFSPWPEFEKQPLRACEQLLKMHRAGPPPVCTVNPEVGQTVSDVVSACLSPDPDQRPASANEVVQALRQAQLEKQLELHEQRARQEEKNRQAAERATRSIAARQAFAWAAMGAVIMSMVGGAWLWMSSKDPSRNLPISLRFQTVDDAIAQIRLSYWTDDLGQAVQQTEAAMVQHDDPRLYAIHAELIRTLNPAGRGDLLPHYEKACEGSNDVRARSNLAALLVRHRDRHQEAIRLINLAIAQDDAFWQPHFSYAKIAMRQEGPATNEQALYHIQRGLDLLPVDQRKAYHYKLALSVLIRNEQYASLRKLLVELSSRGIKRDVELDRILSQRELTKFPWYKDTIEAIPPGSNDGNIYEGMLLPPKDLLRSSLPKITTAEL